MRTLFSLALLLTACTGDDETDDTGETDDTSDSSEDSDTSETDASETETDASETDASETDSDSPTGDPVFATDGPGEGTFGWTSEPNVTVNTCQMNGGMRGNGYRISAVNTSARTFTLTPDAGGTWPAAACSYDLYGAFTCTEDVLLFDMMTYGMEGTVTRKINHSGTFGERSMTINGGAHTFSASWAFVANSHYAFTCVAPGQNCTMAAYNGWGFPDFPCETRIQHGVFSFDDPSYASR